MAAMPQFEVFSVQTKLPQRSGLLPKSPQSA